MATFVGGWGHAEPLVPLARWAEQLGHRVSFAGQAACADDLTRLGFEVDAVGPDTLAAAPRPLVPVDRVAEQAVVRDHFVARFGRARASELGALFDREHVGLVICDEVDVGAIVAAEQRGIPCVTVNVIAAGALTAPAVVGSAWDALRQAHGLAPDPACHRIGGDLVLAPVPRSFRSPTTTTPTILRFVRPPVLDEMHSHVEDPGGRALVYVTLGTVFNVESGDLLARLVQAMNLVSLTHLVEVVITVGDHVAVDELPPPGPAVRVERFVPQRELLGRCRAVVCHAGSGTLVSALSLGLPVVVLPLGADQPDNADRCQELGVGVALDPVTVSAHDLAAATEAVLHDEHFTGAAAELAREARSQPGIRSLPELQRLIE